MLSIAQKLCPLDFYHVRSKLIKSGNKAREVGMVYAWVCQEVGVATYKIFASIFIVPMGYDCLSPFDVLARYTIVYIIIHKRRNAYNK